VATNVDGTGNPVGIFGFPTSPNILIDDEGNEMIDDEDGEDANIMTAPN
jgi:hypothetical protein